MADHVTNCQVATSFDRNTGDRRRTPGSGLLAYGKPGQEMSFKFGQPLRFRKGSKDSHLSFIGTYSANGTSYPVAKMKEIPQFLFVIGLDPDSADAPSELVLSGDGKNVDDTTEFAFIK